MYGLAYLIDPETPSDFISHVWGETALHLPGQPKRFASLFAWREAAWFLDHADLAYPNVGLVLDKTSVSTSTISRSEIAHWREQGATLILNGVQRWHPTLSKYVSELHRQLNAYLQTTCVHVNCYISGPHRQGFDLHYDTHDVFVIQIQGQKAWSVFPSSMKWIGTRDKSLPAPETPYLDCVISEGDVLYIPKGHWHAAVAQDTDSLHLTVGVHVRTGIDFLTWVTERLTHASVDGEPWRQDLPAPGDLPTHLDHIVKHTARYLGDPSLITSFMDHCQATQNDEMNHLHRFAFERTKAESGDPAAGQMKQLPLDAVRQAEKKAIARSLLDKGFDPRLIAEVTGLAPHDLPASANASLLPSDMSTRESGL